MVVTRIEPLDWVAKIASVTIPGVTNQTLTRARLLHGID